jgi:hypothetical protein
VYSKIAIRSFRLDKDFHQKVHNLLSHKAHYIPPLITDLPSAQAALKTAKATLKEIRKNAKAYRESFLEDRAAAVAAAQDITAKQAIKIILQREGTKRAYQTLRKYLKPGQFSPLTEFHMERPDQSIEIISNPNAMFRQIIARDTSHYNQAEGTPCTKQPIKAWLGASGTTPMCDSMLNGLALPFVPGASVETLLLLDQLPCSTPPTPIDDVVTIEDYKNFLVNGQKQLLPPKIAISDTEKLESRTPPSRTSQNIPT